MAVAALSRGLRAGETAREALKRLPLEPTERLRAFNVALAGCAKVTRWQMAAPRRESPRP